MKVIFKHPIFYVASWFAIIFLVASMLTSCGVHYVQCDAYGKLDYKKPSNNGNSAIILKVKSSEPSEEIASLGNVD